MKKRRINVLVLIYMTLLSVCGWAQEPVYLDESQPIEARIKDALSRMTIEEKVALCHAQSKFSSKGVPRLAFLMYGLLMVRMA
jgi:beta-glucosidase